MSQKKEAQKVWLHHATKESKVVIVNSKEYKDMLKDDFRKTMTEVLIDRELLKEAKADEIEGLTSIPSKVPDLSDEELGKLYDECDAELVKRDLLEVPELEKDEDKKDDK